MLERKILFYIIYLFIYLFIFFFFLANWLNFFIEPWKKIEIPAKCELFLPKPLTLKRQEFHIRNNAQTTKQNDVKTIFTIRSLND